MLLLCRVLMGKEKLRLSLYFNQLYTNVVLCIIDISIYLPEFFFLEYVLHSVLIISILIWINLLDILKSRDVKCEACSLFVTNIGAVSCSLNCVGRMWQWQVARYILSPTTLIYVEWDQVLLQYIQAFTSDGLCINGVSVTHVARREYTVFCGGGGR